VICDFCAVGLSIGFQSAQRERLADATIVSATEAKALCREADELTRVFVSSRETARRNRTLERKRGQTTKSPRS
jgi:hypothetical protein